MASAMLPGFIVLTPTAPERFLGGGPFCFLLLEGTGCRSFPLMSRVYVKKRTVRPGQTKIADRCTAREAERRTDMVEGWLREKPYLHSELRQMCREEFDIEWRMADHYIQRAKERLLMSLERTTEEHRARSLAFYEALYRNPAASVSDRLRARAAVDKLLGLRVPEKVHLEHSGTVVTQERQELDSLNLDVATRRKLLKAIRARRQAEDDEEDGEE